MSTRTNAIQRRLELLRDSWSGFTARTEPRLLRWVVDAQSAPLVGTFLEAEQEEIGELSDLFLRFDALFSDPSHYGYVLLRELEAQYAETRDALKEKGFPSDWSCPEPRSGEPDHLAFVRGCVSFRAYHAEIFEHLALALMPQGVADVSAWSAWLTRLAEALPPEVRALVVDAAEPPRLEALAASPRVHTDAPPLDMSGAMREIAMAAGGNTPADHFRRLFLELTQAAGAGNLDDASRAAQSALVIARRQRWSDMQVAVHLALGAGQLGARETEPAIASYREAQVVADAAAARGESSAPKLRVQARLSEGAALVAAEHFAEAAPVYERTMPLAATAEDPLMAMESGRMAAFCHEKTGAAEEAWRCANVALTHGEALEEAMRPNTTLPYLGDALLRLAESRGEETTVLEQRLDALLGAGWREGVAA